MEEQEKENHLDNMGKEIAKLFGKLGGYKMLLSESPQIGIVQIPVDEARIDEIKDLPRVVKRYYVLHGFKLGDIESDEEGFDVLNEKTKERYLVAVDYNSAEKSLNISVSDPEDNKGFSVFG